MGQKITQALEREVWELSTPDAMHECLEELFALGYRGSVKCWWIPIAKTEGAPEDAPAPDPIAYREITLNVDDRAPITAVAGQFVVLFGGVLEAMSAEVYASRFP